MQAERGASVAGFIVVVQTTFEVLGQWHRLLEGRF